MSAKSSGRSSCEQRMLARDQTEGMRQVMKKKSPHRIESIQNLTRFLSEHTMTEED